jgi:hypothetical protein
VEERTIRENVPNDRIRKDKKKKKRMQPNEKTQEPELQVFPFSAFQNSFERDNDWSYERASVEWNIFLTRFCYSLQRPVPLPAVPVNPRKSWSVT